MEITVKIDDLEKEKFNLLNDGKLAFTNFVNNKFYMKCLNIEQFKKWYVKEI
jgi:hypothetical protein